MDAVTPAVQAIDRGELVVYPTETVYGLGADATDPRAIEAVFALKDRPRENPLSVAVAGPDQIARVARPTDRVRRFAEAFLPGPVTVVCERDPGLPGALTGGRERVGVRIPDNPMALQLLRRTPPLTATSANRSGGPSVADPGALDERIRAGVSIVLDGGRTGGTPSTVVDVDAGIVHRRGAQADAVERWLADHPSP